MTENAEGRRRRASWVAAEFERVMVGSRSRGHGIQVPQRTKAEIEAVAAHFRKHLGFTPLEPIQGLRLFEQLNEVTIEVSGSVCGIQSGVIETTNNAEGETYFDEESHAFVAGLSSQTYLALERGSSDRHGRHALDTLGHEVGHVALHARELVEMQRIPHLRAALARNPGRYIPARDSEAQADYFSTCLIMPQAGLALMLQAGHQARDIADHFGVDPLAVSRRLTGRRELGTDGRHRPTSEI